MQNKNIQQNVLAKIQKGEIQMTSRQFFFMKWLTLVVTSGFFLILAVYIYAYVLFLFVDSGLMVIPFDLEGGISKFIVEIPWTLVLLGVFSVFLFSITSKTFYKIYKKPFLTFFFSVITCIVLSHLILMQTGAMKFLKEEAYSSGIKLAPEKLLQFRESQTGSLFVGVVFATTSETLTIRDRKNNLIELFYSNDLENKDFLIGDKINAYATRVENILRVKSIEIID